MEPHILVLFQRIVCLWDSKFFAHNFLHFSVRINQRKNIIKVIPGIKLWISNNMLQYLILSPDFGIIIPQIYFFINKLCWLQRLFELLGNFRHVHLLVRGPYLPASFWFRPRFLRLLRFFKHFWHQSMIFFLKIIIALLKIIFFTDSRLLPLLFFLFHQNLVYVILKLFRLH